MTPYNWENNIAEMARISSYDEPGDLYANGVSLTHGVRPALSLKSCVKYSSGDGSANDPYTIKETTSGC